MNEFKISNIGPVSLRLYRMKPTKIATDVRAKYKGDDTIATNSFQPKIIKSMITQVGIDPDADKSERLASRNEDSDSRRIKFLRSALDSSLNKINSTSKS